MSEPWHLSAIYLNIVNSKRILPVVQFSPQNVKIFSILISAVDRNRRSGELKSLVLAAHVRLKAPRTSREYRSLRNAECDNSIFSIGFHTHCRMGEHFKAVADLVRNFYHLMLHVVEFTI
jgi:hypothetical protein